MNDKWSLVLFTLLTQTGIGLFALAHWLGSDVSVMLWAVGFTLTGMLVSLTHLGRPLAAYRAIRNIGTSWLSREILFLGGFAALAALRCWLLLAQTGGPLAEATGWAAVGLGVLTLYSMAAIYAATAIAAWGTLYTHLAFYTAALILGGCGYILFTGAAAAQNLTLAASLGYAVIAQASGLPLFLARLGAKDETGRVGIGPFGGGSGLLMVGQGLTLLGGLTLGAAAFGGHGGLAYSAVAALLLGQIVLRTVFYGSGRHAMHDRL